MADPIDPTGAAARIDPPAGWEATDDGLRRVIDVSGLAAESLQEQLRATARSAGREVDVVEDVEQLIIRMPVEGVGSGGDEELARRLDDVIAGEAEDTGNPG